MDRDLIDAVYRRGEFSLKAPALARRVEERAWRLMHQHGPVTRYGTPGTAEAERSRGRTVFPVRRPFPGPRAVRTPVRCPLQSLVAAARRAGPTSIPGCPMRWIVTVSVVLLLLVGCGPRGSRGGGLSGTVSYKGQPINGAALTLYDTKGGMLIVPVTPDGTFRTTDVPPGEYKVVVQGTWGRPPRRAPSMRPSPRSRSRTSTRTGSRPT
jgi:hypothetical protein